MAIFRGKRNVSGTLLQLVSILLSDKAFSQSAVSFCDGDNLFVINEDDCRAGLYFGERKPSCICVSGVYRLSTEDCDLFDGFTKNYCVSLWSEGNSKLVPQTLQLASGIGNIYQDTAAVFEEQGDDNTNWRLIGLGMSRRTWSDELYTLNGNAMMIQNLHDAYICVESQHKQEKQVCRYFSSDNPGIWKDNEEMKVVVRTNCSVNGFTKAALKEHKCYNILNQTASSCELTCENGNVTNIPGNTLIRQKKAATSSEFNDAMDENDFAETEPAKLPITLPSSNANFFMHRKLNRYIRLRQVDQIPVPDLAGTAPNNTFALLGIAKRIVRDYCPLEFVSDIFLDQALDLFVILHRGNDLRYYDDLSDREFKFIEGILLKCRSTSIRDPELENLESLHQAESCHGHNYLERLTYSIQDYFDVVNLKRGEHHRLGKYHFVIDAIWQIIDLTHVLCWPTFEQSYRMFHVWEQATEKLFTRDIMSLWFNPQVDLAVYNALLSPRALVDMINLERCVEAKYGKNPKFPELVRHKQPRMHFKRRKREVLVNPLQSVAKNVDVFCAKDNLEMITDC